MAWLMAELPLAYRIENGKLLSTGVLQMAHNSGCTSIAKTIISVTCTFNLLSLGCTDSTMSLKFNSTKFSWFKYSSQVNAIKVIKTTLPYIPRNVGPDHSCLQA